LINKCHGNHVDLSLEIYKITRLVEDVINSVKDTCYSATRDQQRFTVSEVAADWHEPVVPQRIMWPFIARVNGQLDQRCS